MQYSKDETPLEADENGVVTITRDEKELFRPETMASFNGKAFTIRHPEEFVGPDNWSDLAKGVLQNIRRGEGDQKDDLIADILVTDAIAIGMIKNGLREVSCGYEADYVQTGKGKGKQRYIIGNHIALVDQGRAGPSYAINDHKGESKMSYKDRIKALFTKAQDEAAKIIDEEKEKADKESKDEDDKDDDKKAKDEEGAGYDELVKMVKDLGEKISAMAPKAKDEDDKDDDKKDDKEDKGKDEESSVEERLKTLEAAVQKMLENQSEDEDGDDDESEDEDSEDDDFQESTMSGDAKSEVLSRAEILAPGIKPSKDIKKKALMAAFDTKDGKKAIKTLTGGKALVLDSDEKINTLFIAASEVLKASRSEDFSATKRSKETSDAGGADSQGVVTADKMNEINAKFYKN